MTARANPTPSEAAPSSQSPSPGGATAPVVILTRCNVRVEPDDEGPPDDEWHRHRLSIFRQSTWPAVRGQSVAPDAWIWFCHADSPQWFADELRQLADSWEPVRLCFVSEIFTPEMAAAATRAVLPPDTQRVVTARLDNDDAVAASYVADLRAATAADGTYFVNFPNGLQYREGRLYRYFDAANAFVALVEPLEGLKTVFFVHHPYISRSLPVLQRQSRRPMWMQVLHGRNLSNRLRGVRCGARRLAGFRVELPVVAPPLWAVPFVRGASEVRNVLTMARHPQLLVYALKKRRIMGSPSTHGR